MRRCEVYLHGIRAGMLTEEDNGEYTFTYDSSYLEKEDYPSVSLTLPLRVFITIEQPKLIRNIRV